VLCTGDGSCPGATIQCPDVYQCTIDCGTAATVSGACSGAQITCSDTGVCYLACNGPQSCMGAAVGCGSHGCTVNCLNMAASPDVACGNSCGCNHC
jgi:hypothetical protein